MKLYCASDVSAPLANKGKSKTNHFKSLNFIGATRDTWLLVELGTAL